MLIILVAALLLSACSTASDQDQAPPVPDYVINEANRVAEEVNSLKTDGSFSFIAISDTHLDDSHYASIMHAGQAAAIIRAASDIDFAVLLGDITCGDAQTSYFNGIAEILSVNHFLESAFADIPNFRTPGNHDSLSYSYKMNGMFMDNDALFSLIGAYNTGAEYGTDTGGYCYRDFEDFKTRVILLNTSDTEGVTISKNTDITNLSATQAQWFAQSLDLSHKEDAEDWGILILSHMSLDYGCILESAGKILDAYTNGTSTTFTLHDQTIRYDYSGKNQAQIIANIHGHNHCFTVDNMYLHKQSGKKYQSEIKRICIPNASFLRSNEQGQNNKTDSNYIEFGEDITYEKIADTEKDTAFNVVTIDRENEIIYCTNYGAGYDREIRYREATLPDAESNE